MPRYAAIDIGTNSTKITVADVENGQITKIVDEATEITRLGKGVDASGRFSDEAVQKTLGAIQRFADKAHAAGAESIRAGGTSAMRDAQNGDEFRAKAKQIIGSDVEVITGAREAELTYLGAMSDPTIFGKGGASVLAFDVGGGSTELIVGLDGRVERSQSLDIGAVRLTERSLHDDPPTESELMAAKAAAAAKLDEFGKAAVDVVVGIGGTAANVAMMLAPGAETLQGATVTADQLNELLERAAGVPLDERRMIPGLEPARADVIVAGMIIIQRVLRLFDKAEFRVSLRGVRYGLLLEMDRS